MLRILLGRARTGKSARVLEEIRQRDHQDMTRPIAPLKQARDAVVLDTSSLSKTESLAAMKAIIQERIGR